MTATLTIRPIGEDQLLAHAREAFARHRSDGIATITLDPGEELEFRGVRIPRGSEVFFPPNGQGKRQSNSAIVFGGNTGASIRIENGRVRTVKREPSVVRVIALRTV